MWLICLCLIELAETRATTITNLEQAKADLEQVQADLEQKIREHESVRRMLHNTIQELKGNIRVFCRMRPLLENENEDSTESGLSQIKFPDDDAGTQSFPFCCLP